MFQRINKQNGDLLYLQILLSITCKWKGSTCEVEEMGEHLEFNTIFF